MKLTGKSALITGAGTGIGRACANLFAREGASVVLTGRRRDLLEKAVEEIRAGGGRASALAGDVTSDHHARALVEHSVAMYGSLNVLVNNAAFWMAGTIEETSEEDWDRMMNTNLKSVYLLCRHGIPVMRRSGGGSIINIGSVLGLVGMKRRLAYSTSKGGLVSLTRGLALDHAREGIRVNCICPSLVHTPMGRESLQRAGDADSELARRVSQIPLGRAGVPEDAAQLALFLASEESAWITGAAIPLDGGFTAQ